MKAFTLTVVFVITLAAPALHAQHEHHMQSDSAAMNMEGMDMDTDSTTTAPMTSAYSLKLPMNRNGSGTGWLTDKSPIYGYMLHSKKWMFMGHGNIFLRYNSQDITNRGTRGNSKVDAPNWFMFMGQRRVGSKGLFHFSAMLSLDALFGGNGYPLLFQTGESYQGSPLVDRQHPHDLFSELSVSYSQAINKDIDVFTYFGYPGEPALGPVAFMHRPSALNNPDATLGHHWTDATHITFGVATAGIRYKIFKLDGSIFKGREPDEHRYNFDKIQFDSYSYRLTVNPTNTLSMQVSRGFIKSPEALHPEEDVWRTTASVIHTLPLQGENHFLSSVVVWGSNDGGEGHKENSMTVESNLQLDKFAVYGRYEFVQKSAQELLVPGFDAHDTFNVNAFTVGANYTILRKMNTNFSLGVQASVYSADTALDPIYGNNPIAGEVYLRISPTLLKMGMK